MHASISKFLLRNQSSIFSFALCIFLSTGFCTSTQVRAETLKKAQPTSARKAPAVRKKAQASTPKKEASKKKKPATKEDVIDLSGMVKQAASIRKGKKKGSKKAYKPKVRLSKPSSIALPQIDVVGRRPADLDSVPGTADIINQKELRQMAPTHSGEALSKMPGVNVSSEDGMGLRLNIGIRGLDPVRGRKILILEDGIPVSMAPYGEPEMYYTPKIERMKRLVIVKGSGSILWGPQTIGGVLNFITHDPPKEFQLRAEVRYGSYNYFQAHASVGDTINNFGYRFEVLHQRYEGFRALKLGFTDVSGKMVVRISQSNILGIKLQYYNERSNATYLGLTTPQYLNDASQNHAIHDRFPINRYGLALNHKLLFGSAGLLHTRLYAHYVSRFWQRQDFSRANDGKTKYVRIINGSNQSDPNAPNDGSSIFFKNSTGNRNRAFLVGGLESRYTLEYNLGPVANEFIFGLRAHYEQGNEQYINGENAQSPSGSIRDHETRETFALAAYIQNNFMFLNRKLKITPGFRFEFLNPRRHLFRTRVKQPDGTRKAMDTNIIEDSIMIAPIPGIGISYEIQKGFNIFAGMHRGFAPPRTKDSITADGDDLELDPEFSWNYELGLRIRKSNFLYIQAAGFVMDFQNQVIPPSESSGAVATDPGNLGKSVINAGQTLHAGAEASITFDTLALLKSRARLPLSVSYTWVPVARFIGGKYDGNRLPYAPEHLLSLSLRFEHPVGFSASVSGNFITDQTTDKGETITPSIHGLVGRIDARFLLDARIAYTFRLGRYSIGAFVAGKNLTNTKYISSRRPQGIQPGAPLQIFGGIHGSL